MKRTDFSFSLPPELIAQTPSLEREKARLMVIDRQTGLLKHQIFEDILGYFEPGDVLVLNDTRVIPARLWFLDAEGKEVEVLLIRQIKDTDWLCMVSPGKRAREGARLIHQSQSLSGEIISINDQGERMIRLQYSPSVPFLSLLEQIGNTPLPPYIHSDPKEWKDYYQTVYAREDGSIAAPTAGLHFTRDLLEAIQQKGVQVLYITLHVGPGTFRPVKTENVEDHIMDAEWFTVTPETAELINQAKENHHHCFAVGTTVTRTLETVGVTGKVIPSHQSTSLFITPGYTFRVVDRLITNFHLPESTLIMLVSAFYSREAVLSAYQKAIQEKYRFFSFGDAMLLL
ncbi:tRNA preQ1(34) S-adenosylmethionine ribosyltransferase-isomerase QueA [bacterium]|nr:tRNA preQ1(34) S-adenosylmethionine ribosyltransferase-isomerase QueA [bacterium]